MESGEIRPGSKLGPYTLGEELGVGASATVFVGQDGSNRPLAIKVRRRGQADMDRRFLREFESMRLLRVAGVVPVYEAGVEENHLWFSMERVFGQPFHEALLLEPYMIERIERTIDLARRLTTVLTSLHDAGYVHRDIKPTNVLVDAGGDVHVLDFGIGRYFGDADTMSNSGEVLGTVPYMAPEQLGGLPFDEKVDLFATGLMLHEAIAGRRERPSTTLGWIPKICLERLPALATLHREVPRGLSRIVEALLSVDPRDRPTAREAATELQRVAAQDRSSNWPEPRWVDPGPWWLPLEGTLGNSEEPPVWVLEGPAGSGKSRLAEQLHRNGLLQGTWTVHLHCRIDRVGGPLLELMEVLVACCDESSLAAIVGEAAAAVRQMWPQLPLPLPRTDDSATATSGGVAVALAQLVGRVAGWRPVLLIFHDLEQIDRFTARVLPQVASQAGSTLGMLLLHENRWATAVSRELISQLRRENGAGVMTMPRYAAKVGNELIRELCPEAPEAPLDRPLEPRYAVEAGWRMVAAWRGETFEPPDASLWSLAVRDAPVPVALFRALVGRRADDGPWLTIGEDGVRLAGPTAWAVTRPRIGNLRRSAAALASAWERKLGGRREGSAHLASLWLLSGDTSRAWAPAARAALHAESYELFADARQWLLLLDTLPAPRRTTPQQPDLAAPIETGEPVGADDLGVFGFDPTEPPANVRQSLVPEQDLTPTGPVQNDGLALFPSMAGERADRSDTAGTPRALAAADFLQPTSTTNREVTSPGGPPEFDLACAQVRVALHTDTDGVRPDLIDLAERLARTGEQEARVRLLRAEHSLRLGNFRQAVVAALRVASSGPSISTALQIQALLVAVRCRIVLRQVPEALRDLERIDTLLVEHADPLLSVRASNARAELALLQEDLLWCRALCQKNIRQASQHRYVRGIAEAAKRLGQVLRVLGRRREAEHQVRSAREAFAATGDIALDAECGLALATLLVERGEAFPARHLLDETIRRIRGLAMDHLLATSMRVALQVATLTGDTTDAAGALAGLSQARGVDPETPATLVHWWRTRGDVDQALSVPGPEDARSYGAVLWQIERARAALGAGHSAAAEDEARAALADATHLGFAELQLYARLLLGVLSDVSDDAWAEIQRRATASMYTEVFLGALEMDARRLQRSDPTVARSRWQILMARSHELGYRPGVEEASGWLQAPP